MLLRDLRAGLGLRRVAGDWVKVCVARAVVTYWIDVGLSVVSENTGRSYGGRC